VFEWRGRDARPVSSTRNNKKRRQETACAALGFRWNCAASLRHCFGVCSKIEAANQHAGSVRKRPEEPAWTARARTKSGSLSKIIVSRAQRWEMMRTPQRADADQRRKRSQDSETLSLFITWSQPSETTGRLGTPKLQDSQDSQDPEVHYQDTKTGRCCPKSVLAISHWWMFAAVVLECKPSSRPMTHSAGGAEQRCNAHSS
jgi:hypothetical protein